MESTTLVTAFFDINRKDFKQIPRSNDKYHQYFEFWSRIRNPLIVYTDKENLKIIEKIRSSYGLKDKTKIIVLENIFDLEADIFTRLNEIEKDKFFNNFRENRNATSNSGKYNYIMLMKSWFLKDAVNYCEIGNNIAWIDYGFNHGGKVFDNPLDFDFEWQPRDVQKINLYYMNELDNRPIFEIIKRLDDCIMGPIILLPNCLANRFYEMNKESMKILNSIGLMDDDQLLMLFSQRRHPEEFEMIQSDWFLPLKLYNGDHLSVRQKKTPNPFKGILIKIYIIALNTLRRLKYHYRNFINY